MSLHAIEDVVEWSIRALHARYPDEDPSVRDAIAALYAFQHGYDCSFTQPDPPVVAAVRAIREATIRSGALSHDAPGEYRLPPEAFDEGGLDAWWAGREDHDLEFLR